MGIEPQGLVESALETRVGPAESRCGDFRMVDRQGQEVPHSQVLRVHLHWVEDSGRKTRRFIADPRDIQEPGRRQLVLEARVEALGVHRLVRAGVPKVGPLAIGESGVPERGTAEVLRKAILPVEAGRHPEVRGKESACRCEAGRRGLGIAAAQSAGREVADRERCAEDQLVIQLPGYAQARA